MKKICEDLRQIINNNKFVEDITIAYYSKASFDSIHIKYMSGRYEMFFDADSAEKRIERLNILLRKFNSTRPETSILKRRFK